MLFNKVVDEGTLRKLPSGFSVGVRLPWYRALPLSCISINLLKVDGKTIDPKRMRFHINGHSYSLDELPSHMRETWFSVDTATLEVSGTDLDPMTDHEVEAQVEVRPPYIKNLRRVGHAVRSMKAILE